MVLLDGTVPSTNSLLDGTVDHLAIWPKLKLKVVVKQLRRDVWNQWIIVETVLKSLYCYKNV